jgi:hypothetical protein
MRTIKYTLTVLNRTSKNISGLNYSKNLKNASSESYVDVDDEDDDKRWDAS